MDRAAAKNSAGEILLANLSLCQPQSALSDGWSDGRWMLMDYETDDSIAGRMLYYTYYPLFHLAMRRPADEEFLNPPTITLPMAVSGRYEIRVGMHYASNARLDGPQLLLRLSQETAFARLAREQCQSKDGDFPEKTGFGLFDVAEEVLNTNIFDAWSYRHPTATPWRTRNRVRWAAAVLSPSGTVRMRRRRPSPRTTVTAPSIPSVTNWPTLAVPSTAMPIGRSPQVAAKADSAAEAIDMLTRATADHRLHPRCRARLLERWWSCRALRQHRRGRVHCENGGR